MANANILKTSDDVLPFLPDIKAATDANRDSLGFNPVGAYKDAIKRGRLWVAVDPDGKYLGHIMHGGRPPQEVRIFQIYVSDVGRGSGVAAAMIDAVALHAEQLSCLNLRADVAGDLTSAVKLWQSQGFCALAPRRKKNLTGREVRIFFKRLSTPSLLPNDPLPFSITTATKAISPDSYVIDLNIFFTLIKERDGQDLIAEIMQAAMAGEFSLYVTPEFQAELRRTKKDNDPIYDLAEKTLPVLDQIDDRELAALQKEIRAIVFPQRSQTRKAAAQDESDLRHLAYCIQNSKAGFLTDEKALLRAKDELSLQYGLTIYSPEDFKIATFNSVDHAGLRAPLSKDGQSIQISSLKTATQIRPFLNSLGSNLEPVAKLILKTASRGVRERTVIEIGEDVCAVYLAATSGTKHDEFEGYFVSRGEVFDNRSLVFEHVLECFLRQSQTLKAGAVTFYVRSEDFDLENICLQRGFERAQSSLAGMIALVKIPCPLIVTKSNWGVFRDSFKKNTGIELPSFIPTAKVGEGGKVSIAAVKSGRVYDAELSKLETLLSPSLFLLPDRSGVIIPIHPAFASNLLSRAEDLLPFAMEEEALLRLEKAYFRKPTQTKMFTPGAPIAFYESGSGRGVIGCARITSTSVTSCDNAIKLHRKHGVLRADELSSYADKHGDVQVITFDNFKPFVRPVTMKRLQELGAAKANLVGPEVLPYSQLFRIVHEGLGIHSRDVLLSIQPDFVDKILSGKKSVELRKKPFPANGGVRVWIYSTSPTCAVEAVAFVDSVDVDTPDNIWRKYQHKCGISRTAFDTYFADCGDAYAVNIARAHKLEKRIKLEHIKKISDGFTPPQYYRYVEHDTVLFDALISA